MRRIVKIHMSTKFRIVTKVADCCTVWAIHTVLADTRQDAALKRKKSASHGYHLFGTQGALDATHAISKMLQVHIRDPNPEGRLAELMS